MTRSENLLITLGDPNGLGPELVCRLLAEEEVEKRILLIGPESSLEMACQQYSLSPFWLALTDPSELHDSGAGVYLYEPSELKGFIPEAGQPTMDGGQAAGLCIETALEILKTDVAGAMVTCPLNKARLQEAGYKFTGHTEFLAEGSGIDKESVCMHLSGPRLRVSLVTTHPPLREVADHISIDKILQCLRLTWRFIQALGLQEIPIGVCGLNPHAGEEGMIGTEELDIILPAVEKAKEEGIFVQGPIPADTLFYFAARKKYSAVLAMYHDQGLAPLKLLHFHEAVNITLGLPFIRTSVDHGTGYDLVGTGRASVGSLKAAIDLAHRLLAADYIPL